MDEKGKTNIFQKMKIEAKEYYKGKNMTIRYIVLGFLLLLIIIQIILPYKKVKLIRDVDAQPQNIEDYSTFSFLGDEIDIDDMNTLERIKFDRAVHEILSNDIGYIYKVSQLYLPMIQNIFEEYNIPDDLSYLVMVGDAGYPVRHLSESVQSRYGILNTEGVMESLNLQKMTLATAQYFNFLYKKYKDRYYVVSAYSMPTGENGLNAELSSQNNPNSSKFYNISGDEEYYLVMGYSYIFQNLENYIDIDNIQLYDQFHTKIVDVSNIKDLVKRSKKNNYSYKEVRELNPWIIGNSLPKGKWEIIIKDR